MNMITSLNNENIDKMTFYYKYTLYLWLCKQRFSGLQALTLIWQSTTTFIPDNTARLYQLQHVTNWSNEYGHLAEIVNSMFNTDKW